MGYVLTLHNESPLPVTGNFRHWSRRCAGLGTRAIYANAAQLYGIRDCLDYQMRLPPAARPPGDARSDQSSIDLPAL
jgi:hypothetical protein